MAKIQYRWQFNPKGNTTGNIMGLWSLVGCMSLIFIFIWVVVMVGYLY